MMDKLSFPGATGITHLRVYDTESQDGVHGGSPHMHLLSAEAYITSKGFGEVQLLSPAGFETRALDVGGIVWFEPGVIHRLVNTSHDLEILVVMQNAGLPEAGDAVFTFPEAVMFSADTYNAAIKLPEGDESTRQQAAWKRRNLAVQGYEELLAAPDREAALTRFYRNVIERRSHLFERWSELLANGPETEARLARERLAQLAARSTSGLSAGRSATTPGGDEHPGVGMCGMLRQYDLAQSN